MLNRFLSKYFSLVVALTVLALCGSAGWAEELGDVTCETYLWNSNLAETNLITAVNTFGQTWTTGSGVNNLSKIKILISRAQGSGVTESSLGDLTCVVYPAVGSNIVLGWAKISKSNIGSSGTVAWFVFAKPIALQPQTQYYFEISATGGYNISGDYVDCYTEFHGLDTHAGGQIYHDRLGDWSNADMWFDTYYETGKPNEQAEIVCETYNWNENIFNSDGGNRTTGQSFTSGSDLKCLSRIRLLLGRYEDPMIPGLGDPTVKVYSDITASSLLGTSSIPKDIMPNSFNDGETIIWVGQRYDFAFNPPIALKPNTQYYFELSVAGGDGQNSYINEYHGLDAYTGGQMYHSRLSDWSNADMHFSTFVVPLTGKTCPQLISEGYLSAKTADLNKDCYVNFKDLAVLAQSWMTCIDPENDICE